MVNLSPAQTGGWPCRQDVDRSVYNAELHNLCSHAAGAAKSRRIGWAGHKARMKNEKSKTSLSGNWRGTQNIGDLGEDWRIILKSILEKSGRKMWIEMTQNRVEWQTLVSTVTKRRIPYRQIVSTI